MPPRIQTNLQISQLTPPTSISSSQLCSRCLAQRPLRHSFSTGPVSSSENRAIMHTWLNGPGSVFKHPLPGATNYLSAYNLETGDPKRVERSLNQDKGDKKEDEEDEFDDTLSFEEQEGSNLRGEERTAPVDRSHLRPFPLNQNFVSQPVLSDEFRQEIWKRVKVWGESVRAVSADMSVEMKRVAAVVRLVELEREMERQAKPMAIPYAKAVLKMLPTTPFRNHHSTKGDAHESINDIPVHRLTQPQIFYPVSESRHFTREDAGRVFSAAPRKLEHNPDDPNSFKQRPDHSILKPVDERIAHPQLLLAESVRKAGGVEEKPWVRKERAEAWMNAEEEAIRARKEKEEERERRELKKVETKRFEFRFRDVSVSRDTVGLDGRGRKGVGRRYGVPHYDRKRGQVKIPTSVDA